MSTHTHPCLWQSVGCTGRVECSGQRDPHEEDPICEYEGESFECEDCRDAAACPSCGVWAFHLGDTYDDSCDLFAADVLLGEQA